MKNTQYNYDSVYGFIRYFYISALPQFAACEPHEIMNAHLKSSGSTLMMAKPGRPQVVIDGPQTDIERFLLDKNQRDLLYVDISEMADWLLKQGYLDFNSAGNGSYRAKDVLLRTPSLNFELKR